MSKGRPKNMAASVRSRLADVARKNGDEFQLVLTRYAVERFLYRLAASGHGEVFVLKGAMLFQLWAAEPHRATRDVDLLGSGDSSVERLTAVARAACSADVPDDGLVFDPGSAAGGRIKEDQEYEGVRVTCVVRLGQARVALQVDIGFGDAVTPGPERVVYPTILDFPAPVLLAYPRETVVAEKFQAMVALGIANSRMKDFFDLWVLARDFPFDGAVLARAVAATFHRRATPVPASPPLALTAGFGSDLGKVKQWEAFVRKGRLRSGGATLGEVCRALNGFLMPVSRAAEASKEYAASWPPGGPWSAAAGPGS